MDADATAKLIGEAIAARYRRIAAGAMAGLPICNAALAVAAEGFRVHAGRAIGIVVTPWFMNLVAADLAEAPPRPALRAGCSIKLALPAGDVELIVGELPGFGRLDSCSLFSPMDEFADMASAMATAREAMRGLFEAETSRPARRARPPGLPARAPRRRRGGRAMTPWSTPESLRSRSTSRAGTSARSRSARAGRWGSPASSSAAAAPRRRCWRGASIRSARKRRERPPAGPSRSRAGARSARARATPTR